MKKQIAQEAIKYQGTIFFNELVDSVKTIRGKREAAFNEYLKSGELAKLIKYHTNLVIELVNEEGGPAVYIPDLNRNNVIFNKDYRIWLENEVSLKFFADNKTSLLTGSINLITGKVTGDYTKIESKMILPYWFVSNPSNSNEEIAAVILHEVGHVSTSLEYLGRILSTNYALQVINEKYHGDRSVEERKVILKDIETGLGLKNLDINSLSKKSDRLLVQTMILKADIERSESQIGSSIYDATNCEFLADQYAQRQGAGRYLVTVLSRLENADSKKGAMFMMSQIATAVVFGLSAVFIPVVGIGTFAALVLLGLVGESVDMTYDRTFNRLRRIRNQMIETLKDKTIPKEVSDAIYKDIQAIDELDLIHEDKRGIFDFITSSLSPHARRRMSDEKLQRELESLANNDLFLKAKELSNLPK